IMSVGAIRVAGVGMTRFARQAARGHAALAHEAIGAALDDAGLCPADVDAVFCGCIAGGSGIGQHCVKDLGFAGVPVTNIENACASSSSALVEAAAWIGAGMADVALVFGVEILTGASGPLPPPRSGWMFDTGLNLPGWYALQASSYMERYGATDADLAAVTVKSRSLAASNPRAHFREPTSIEAVLADPMIAEPLTRSMCCPRTDGAAAAILVSGRAARAQGGKGILLAGFATGGGMPVFTDRAWPQTSAQRVASQALDRAGVGPGEVDVAEVHDAFAVGEWIYAEALGLLPPGTAAARTARGETMPNNGPVAVNPSGGLLSRGHPLGASGLAMVVEIVEQLQGRSGPRQVEEARVGVTLTMGANEFELDTNICVGLVFRRD
ncbi:MAG: thiolase family protein, partial [Thermaurantiacus sp.]